MESVKPSPGRRIREARNGLGISQKAFASRLGTTRRRIIAWEGGDNTPSALYLQRIASVTGRTVDFFLDGAEDADDAEAAESMDLARDLAVAIERVVDARMRERVSA